MAQFLLTKNHSEIYNLDHIYNIFIHMDTCSIKATNNQTRGGGLIGRYDTPEECRAALEIIMRGIQSGGVVYVPGDEQVRAALADEGDKHQNGYHGSKPVRRGGS